MASFWWAWLVIITCSVIFFGLSLVIAPKAMQRLFNAMVFSVSQAHKDFADVALFYIELIYGVLGAVMVGWRFLFYTF
jgi:uncharacterized membrane protein YhaH (DUF805 family)